MDDKVHIYVSLNGTKYYYKECGSKTQTLCSVVDMEDGLSSGKKVLHREDGPAVEWTATSYKSYFINGSELDFEEWFEWVMAHSSKENQINVLLNLDKI